MRLYNPLTLSLDTFTPRTQPVTIYVCGITPYDTTHLGHAFTYATFDILIRYLEFLGHTVTYVQNVTDIDDDILRKAGEEGADWLELGNAWTAHFIRDMLALNVRPPEHYTRATDFVPQIIASVEKLLAAGVAYEANGSVYYRVAAWPHFGELSHLPAEEMLPIANERGNNPDDPNKDHPLDFVLWQAQAPGEPAWGSPWGMGRPGWHIECSTMSTDLLGATIDFHGGGGDLIFPHHECEIAQAEAATGHRPFVRHWIHAAMVHHDGAKMSKSLGNLVMVRDLLQVCSPDALRLYLADHHYREPWSFDATELERAGRRVERLHKAANAAGGDGAALDPAPATVAYREAMDDDLNVPAALIAVEALAESIIDVAADGRDVSKAQDALRSFAAVFGLRLGAPGAEVRVSQGWERHLQRFTPPG